MYTRFMIELSVKVFGRVQGVFFRQSTKAVADQLGAVGWVKNCSDGTVEALFQASPSIIQDLKLFIQRGPSKAQVEEVLRFFKEKITKSLEGFTILYE